MTFLHVRQDCYSCQRSSTARPKPRRSNRQHIAYVVLYAAILCDSSPSTPSCCAAAATWATEKQKMKTRVQGRRSFIILNENRSHCGHNEYLQFDKFESTVNLHQHWMRSGSPPPRHSFPLSGPKIEKILKDLDLDLNNPEHGERFLPHSPHTNHKHSILFRMLIC